MCTVSWLHHDDGYHLLCNRDEKSARARAHAPEMRVRDGVRYLAPADGEAGGTWIATNEYGLSLCLLNGRTRPGAWNGRLTSRGLLVGELISSASVDDVLERVWRSDLARFAGFTLVALEPGGHTSVVEWDGVEKAIVAHAQPLMPLVSSSFDFDEVYARRRDEFRRRLDAASRLDPRVLYSFHSSHAGNPDAYSPCMHRADAETVSFSWVKVTTGEAEFFYSPDAPFRGRGGEVRQLALVQ
jgi:hypothetical protein